MSWTEEEDQRLGEQGRIWRLENTALGQKTGFQIGLTESRKSREQRSMGQYLRRGWDDNATWAERGLAEYGAKDLFGDGLLPLCGFPDD